MTVIQKIDRRRHEGTRTWVRGSSSGAFFPEPSEGAGVLLPSWWLIGCGPPCRSEWWKAVELMGRNDVSMTEGSHTLYSSTESWINWRTSRTRWYDEEKFTGPLLPTVNRVAGRVLMLRPGVRPVPLRWKTELSTLVHQRPPSLT